MVNDAPRRVLITGAASGIGHAIARVFIETGWQVSGLDRVAAPAGLGVDRWMICDLENRAAVDDAVAALRLRPLQALVNCAGVAGTGDPSRVLRINFFAARQIVDGLAACMSDNGAIILISSGAGMQWTRRTEILAPVLNQPDLATTLEYALSLCDSPAKAYVISKELLSYYGMRICLDQAARGVRVNVLSPGGVETPLTPEFTRSMGPEAMDFSLSVTGRHGRPEEIADAALFLASPAARWINGAELRVDGGLTGALAAGVVSHTPWQ